MSGRPGRTIVRPAVSASQLVALVSNLMLVCRLWLAVAMVARQSGRLFAPVRPSVRPSVSVRCVLKPAVVHREPLAALSLSPPPGIMCWSGDLRRE